MNWLIWLVVFGFGLISSSCINPMASINQDIKQFKQNFPNQIQSFSGQNKTMGFAFSGDANKPPLVFVHGSPGSWEGWAHFLLNSELQKKFHLIAVDRPGYGLSSAGTAVSSLKVQASDIVEVLKFNKSGRAAIFVGHSFGGPVIARLAMDFPDQVAGLIFVASSVSPELEYTKWFQYPASWWPIRVLIPTDLRVCNEEILPLKSELQLLMPGWKGIRSYTALIQGEDDDLVPPENLDFLIKNIDPSHVVSVSRINGLNHFVPWKRPDLILEAIEKISNAILKNIN